MVAYIKELAVTRHGWLDQRSFRNGVALCQTIPGATAMQMAAYVGLRLRGLGGGLAAYAGFGLPAFALMLGLSALYQHTHTLPAAGSLFHGLRVIVVALMANATLNFGRSSLRKGRDAMLAGLAAAALAVHASPMLVILAAAIAGCLVCVDARPGEPQEAAPPVRGGSIRNLLWPMAAIGLALAALWLVDPQLFQLAATMLRIDLFAFGGGFASVPLMQHEFVSARHWMDAKTFMDGIALGQVTPGPIVITATFAGYMVRGVVGALVGTISIFAPSLVILTLALPVFDRLQVSRYFRGATRGALLAFVGMLLWVTASFGLALTWSIPAAVLGIAALTALRLKVDILWVVAVGAILSVLFL
jgi:chromate transporter